MEDEADSGWLVTVSTDAVGVRHTIVEHVFVPLVPTCFPTSFHVSYRTVIA